MSLRSIKESVQNDLISRLENINWMEFKSPRLGSVPASEVHTSFLLKKKGDLNSPMEVRIRIGLDIITELDWKDKDRIGIFFNPDDVFTMRLVKMASKNGYALAKPSNVSRYYQFNFTWPHTTIKINEKRSSVVDHLVHKGQLILLGINR